MGHWFSSGGLQKLRLDLELTVSDGMRRQTKKAKWGWGKKRSRLN